MPITSQTKLVIVWVAIPNTVDVPAWAQALLRQKLVACIQCLPAMQSFYIWEGQAETAEEQLLLLKTTVDRVTALTEWLKGHHPYDVPEILTVPVIEALPAYAAWVQEKR